MQPKDKIIRIYETVKPEQNGSCEGDWNIRRMMRYWRHLRSPYSQKRDEAWQQILGPQSLVTPSRLRTGLDPIS